MHMWAFIMDFLSAGQAMGFEFLTKMGLKADTALNLMSKVPVLSQGMELSYFSGQIAGNLIADAEAELIKQGMTREAAKILAKDMVKKQIATTKFKSAVVKQFGKNFIQDLLGKNGVVKAYSNLKTLDKMHTNEQEQIEKVMKDGVITKDEWKKIDAKYGISHELALSKVKITSSWIAWIEWNKNLNGTLIFYTKNGQRYWITNFNAQDVQRIINGESAGEIINEYLNRSNARNEPQMDPKVIKQVLAIILPTVKLPTIKANGKITMNSLKIQVPKLPKFKL